MIDVISNFMKNSNQPKIFIFILAISLLISCNKPTAKQDYLLLFTDTIKDEYGYKNQKGDTVIALGRYPICFTDTFKTYAIVSNPPTGYVAIDRQGKELYTVFPFDNGPDYSSEGLFRILDNSDSIKIGYASSQTGQIVIKPQFKCAFPFKNGIAKVSVDCETESDGEHTQWLSNNWYYIDTTGKKVAEPTRDK